MFKLIQNGHLFSPDDLGVHDILVCDEKIVSIQKNLSTLADALGAQVIDAGGKRVVPGFIDAHAHFLGGGDDEGPGGETTDIQFSSLTRGGITTAVSCIGTDDTARTMLDLLRAARGLQRIGITTYIYSGSLNVPSKTITGDVRNDLAAIEKILGVKFAISEPLASYTPIRQLAQVARDAYLGAVVAGKKGVVHIHLGRRHERLKPLFKIIQISGLPVDLFVPTHINRNDPQVIEQAVEFTRIGGTVDLNTVMSPRLGSSTGMEVEEALCRLLKARVPIGQVTVSTDGNVSMPFYDQNGRQDGIYRADVSLLHRTFLRVVKHCPLGFSEALKPFTANVARVLGLDRQKGAIAIGKDADLVILSDKLEIDTVIARGRIMVRQGDILVRGPFEKNRTPAY